MIGGKYRYLIFVRHSTMVALESNRVVPECLVSLHYFCWARTPDEDLDGFMTVGERSAYDAGHKGAVVRRAPSVKTRIPAHRNLPFYRPSTSILLAPAADGPADIRVVHVDPSASDQVRQGSSSEPERGMTGKVGVG